MAFYKSGINLMTSGSARRLILFIFFVSPFFLADGGKKRIVLPALFDELIITDSFRAMAGSANEDLLKEACSL